MSRTVTVEIDAVTVDADTVDNVRITYGRQRITDQPAPSQCVLTLLTDMTSFDYTVGQSVEVIGTINTTDYQRFTGRIAQVRVGRYTTELVCTSTGLGAVAHEPRGEIEFESVEKAGTIIEYIWNYGSQIPTGNFQLGDVELAKNVVYGPGNALDLMQTVANYDLNGVVWEDQSGVVYYDAGRTVASPANLEVLADHVLDTWIAEQTVDSIVNACTVTYDGGEVTVSDAGSIADHGQFGQNFDTPIATEDDAYTKAARQISPEPTFATYPLTVLLKTMSDADAGDLLSLGIGATLDLSAVAAEIPGVPSTAFLEGYDETIRSRGDDWQLALYVSDVQLTRIPQRWSEVTANLEWDQVSATLTWLQAIGQQL
jgi:hypothetical protein